MLIHINTNEPTYISSLEAQQAARQERGVPIDRLHRQRQSAQGELGKEVE